MQPADELLEHVRCIREQRASDINWQVMSASYPHMAAKGQRAVNEKLRSLQVTRERQSAYEMVAGSDKVRLIGNAIFTGGEAWKRSHRKQLEWLRSQGITPEQAVGAYQEWASKA